MLHVVKSAFLAQQHSSCIPLEERAHLMKEDIFLENGIIIPAHELEITTSRAGGPGGQHVNKTNTRITIRWNVKNTTVLSETLKERILTKLHAQLTTEGDLIIHSSESRSQLQNKKAALVHLTRLLNQALKKPKKRVATKVSAQAKEERLAEKSRRSETKRMRSKKFDE
jgi:ribosome-associated protein